MNAPALAAARWVTPSYCEACHANHPGPCGCWCHQPAARDTLAPVTSYVSRECSREWHGVCTYSWCKCRCHGSGGRARDWRSRAACASADPDLFFPVSHPHSDAYDAETARAKAVCRACPVTADCLRYATATRQPHGIWGGTTAGEREAARLSLAGRVT